MSFNKWLAIFLLCFSLNSQANTNDPCCHLNFENNLITSAGRLDTIRPIANPKFVDGLHSSTALAFDGIQSALSLGDPACLRFDTHQNFTIALWVKTKGWQSDPSIISNKNWQSGQNPGWGIFGTGNGANWKANIADRNNRVDANGGIINDNQWHHIAVTFNRLADMVLYQDGRPVGKAPIAHLKSTRTGLPTVIAQDGTLQYPSHFKGTIDNLIIWPKALSPEQIADLFITGLAGSDFNTPKKPQATLPHPADGANNIPIKQTLRWRAAFNPAEYHVYFAKKPTFQNKKPIVTKNSAYQPTTLNLGETYYWKVNTKTKDGQILEGPTWSFHTKSAAVAEWVFHSPTNTYKIADRVGRDNLQVAAHAEFAANPNAIVFHGQTDTLSRSQPQQTFPKPAFSLETWISIAPNTQAGTLLSSPMRNKNSWSLGFHNYKFQFHLSTPIAQTTLTSPDTFITERWRHIAATYDGLTARLFINGMQVDESIASSQPAAPMPYPQHFGHAQNGLTPFHGKMHSLRLFDRALTKDEVAAVHAAAENTFPKPINLSFGPYLQFTDPSTALIRWETTKPVRCIVEYGRVSPSQHRLIMDTTATKHQIQLTGLKPQVKYRYVIKYQDGNQLHFTQPYECDNFFNYSIPKPINIDRPYTNKPSRLAKHLLARLKAQKGYAVILDGEDGKLAYEFAKQSDLFVHGFTQNTSLLSQARKYLLRKKMYGIRATMRHVEALDSLPLTSVFANAAIYRLNNTNAPPTIAEEIHRIVQPRGGIGFIVSDTLSQDELKQWLEKSSINYTIHTNNEWTWAEITRADLPGSGEWTHQYGHPDNSANSNETLQGTSKADKMQVQWIGRPGSRAMVDRNPRKPAPLAVNGRLFTQGLHRMIAQDAYNGAILWSLEIPHLERFNMPRDSGNWCADDNYIYAAIRNRCWRIDAANGNLAARFTITQPNAQKNHYWGYIARYQDKLYGSTVKADAIYTNFWGGATTGWADATTGPITHKVGSDTLFARDPDTGEEFWSYKKGVILNSTITIADGRVFFVEIRHPKILASPSRRLGRPEMWTDRHLVALNADTGELEWEKKIETVEGIIVYYMSYAKDTLFITASKKKYHIYAYDANHGSLKWNAGHAWIKDNHGQHMQHPAITKNTIYVRPRGYRLSDGKVMTQNMPPHEGGCATFCAAGEALVYRGKQGCISMWDVNDEQVSYWYSIRPGCWLSTVVAGGMILSPEGGGGCSCGGWLETSVGFIPDIVNQPRQTASASE